MKYIIFDNLHPVIFRELFTHADVAHVLGRYAYEGVVTGAGFCSIDAKGDWNPYGKSESLGISMSVKDRDILNTWMK